MHRFLFYQPADNQAPPDLNGAHLLGNDGIPIRGEIRLVDGGIQCTSRTQDPFGISLLWPVAGFGRLQLETTRLPERDTPYVLNVELARHRLMRITLKREEWGLFDFEGMEEISAQIEQARAHFISALENSDDPPTAARLADESLRLGLVAAERLCQFHASVFLDRRQQGNGFRKEVFGATISTDCSPGILTPPVRELFNFIRIPFVWRDLQSKEADIRFKHIDPWIKAGMEARLALYGGPLLDFRVGSVPDWMYIWENDFETILDYAREHVRRSVKRYVNYVTSWIVASGVHADCVFSFNFEQIMEITRMAVTTTKEIAPHARIILDLTQPWGEYFARNQRSIPPLLYADLAVQSGIPFDAFGLQFLFGIKSEGYYLRDLLQISALIDKLANLNKPLHITAVAVPSTAGNSNNKCDKDVHWSQPWTDQIQADWLVAFCETALSKPYVESVCLQTLADDDGGAIPCGGILRKDHSPKPAFDQLKAMIQRLQGKPAE